MAGDFCKKKSCLKQGARETWFLLQKGHIFSGSFCTATIGQEAIMNRIVCNMIDILNKQTTRLPVATMWATA